MKATVVNSVCKRRGY